jgi:hypothetical protein
MATKEGMYDYLVTQLRKLFYYSDCDKEKAQSTIKHIVNITYGNSYPEDIRLDIAKRFIEKISKEKK